MVQTLWSSRRTTCKSKQRKKHFTQMSLQDKLDCVDLLREATRKPLKVTKHYQEKSLTRLDFKKFCTYIQTNKNAKHCIVEYNETQTPQGTQRRVLFRRQGFTRIEGKKCQQYLVIDVDNSRLITTYYNEASDTHKTLDLRYYDKNLTIKKETLL